MTTYQIFTDEDNVDAYSVGADLSRFARKASAQTFSELQTFSEGAIISEVASAPAAVAGAVVLYAADNGSGKLQLMARFPTGAAQQLAIEP